MLLMVSEGQLLEKAVLLSGGWALGASRPFN